jgi:predicted GNAT family acetyltransferase
MEAAMQLDVQHDPEASRFHVPPEVIDGDVQHKMANMGTVLSYHRVGEKVLDFRSTLVPPHLRGKGVGTELVKQALDWARAEGYTIVPSCSFVARFLEENPEYQDLVADQA